MYILCLVEGIFSIQIDFLINLLYFNNIGVDCMDNQLIVKNADGQEETIHVIDIITDNETGKKYLFYTRLESDEIYASILRETEGAFVLETITDDSEWELVEEILKSQIMVEGDTNE